MPQVPGSLAQAAFTVGILVPLGLVVLGLVYIIGLTVAQGFKKPQHQK